MRQDKQFNYLLPTQYPLGQTLRIYAVRFFKLLSFTFAGILLLTLFITIRLFPVFVYNREQGLITFIATTMLVLEVIIAFAVYKGFQVHQRSFKLFPVTILITSLILLLLSTTVWDDRIKSGATKFWENINLPTPQVFPNPEFTPMPRPVFTLPATVEPHQTLTIVPTNIVSVTPTSNITSTLVLPIVATSAATVQPTSTNTRILVPTPLLTAQPAPIITPSNIITEVLTSVPTSPVTTSITATPTPIDRVPLTSTNITTDVLQSIVQLIRPANNAVGSGVQEFLWYSNYKLKTNEAYEVIMWKEGQDPLRDGLGIAAPTTVRYIKVNLDDLVFDEHFPSGDMLWGILLVNKSRYSRIQYLGGGYHFFFTPVPLASSENIKILSPNDGAVGNGVQEFRWQTGYELKVGEAFEVIFWKPGQVPISDGFGIATPTQSTYVRTNLTQLYDQGIIQLGKYQWGVLVIQLNPYSRLQYLGEGYRFEHVPN